MLWWLALRASKQLATIAGVAEAIVNLSVSIYLVQRIGAVGVAIGTLVGAFVSLGLHLFCQHEIYSFNDLGASAQVDSSWFPPASVMCRPSILFQSFPIRE